MRLHFLFKLGSDFTLAQGNLGFDLGLPALGLSVNGQIQLKSGFDLNLAFGVDRSKGVFFNTSLPDELRVYADATLPGFSATGKLGFLNVTATDAGSHIGGQFVVNISDPSGDGTRYGPGRSRLFLASRCWPKFGAWSADDLFFSPRGPPGVPRGGDIL